ncbi:MAG: hypothetical protein HYY06_24290 [Deltaproteobacteria bacterium]|nr:hypothetical protein [Deltaproteobacteria bacterium]
MSRSVKFLSVAWIAFGTAACTPETEPERDDPLVDAGPGAADAGADTAPSVDEPVAAPECDEIPSVPVEYRSIPGFTATEDFQFDADGRWVGADDNGNVVRITRDGERRLFVPNAGDLSGMRFLPSGDLVFARVDDGTLYRAAQNGAAVPVLSGLVYPNGLEVDLDGFVYVSEQSAGRVRKVDPLTGEFTIVARGLQNPNGLSFSPDYRTLYCGSFGAGVIYAIGIGGDGNPETPTIFAQTPESPGAEEPTGPDERSIAACEGARGGEACSFDGDEGPEDGVCYALGDRLYCDTGSSDPWLAACQDLAAGDACTVEQRGTGPMQGTCTEYAGLLYCDPGAGSWDTGCEGLAEGDACTIDQGEGSEPLDGTCVMDSDVLFCWPELEDDPFYVACSELDEDAPCSVEWYGSTYEGRCADFDLDGFYCWSDEGGGERGGLDGMAVDECGYVYATEYGVGIVWRISPDGGEVEMLMDPDAAWIPNLHWGPGVGGFDRETLYIANRVDGSLFEVPLGIAGKPRSYP